MQNIFINLDEASNLEELSYHAFWNRIKHNKDNYITKTEPSPSGGRPRILVAVSSLSLKAQNEYWKQENKKFNSPLPEEPKKKVHFNLAELEACVGKEKLDKLMEDANKALDAVKMYKDYCKVLDSKVNAADMVAEKYGISRASVYNYVKQYDERGFLSLVRLPLKFKEKRYIKRTSLHEDVIKLIRGEYLQLNGPRPMHIYRKVVTLCEEKGIAVPSKDSIYRYIDDMNQLEPDYICFAREGEEAYDKKFAIKAVRKDPDYANQVWEGDHHRCDFFIEYNGKPVRPWLTIWFDVCTRTVRGTTLAIQANGRTITQAFRHGVLEKRLPEFNEPDINDKVFSTIARLGWLPRQLEEVSEFEIGLYGLPQELYIDNGEDYKAKMKQGLKHKDWEYSNEIRNSCQALHIDVRFCTKYSPWAKGHCERWFGTFTDQFSRYMPGYCGKDNKSRPAGLDENKMCDRGELLTLEEAYYLIEFYIHFYHSATHSSLGMTPYEKVQTTAMARNEMPNERDLDFCLMDVDKATVRSSGIQKFGTKGKARWYTNPELKAYVGKEVIIRYDPLHIGSIYVFDPKTGGDYICTATNAHAMTFNASQDDIKTHQKQRAKRKKDIRERLKEDKQNTFEAMVTESRMAGKNFISGTTEKVKDAIPMVTGLGSIPKTVEKQQKKADAQDKLPKAVNDDGYTSIYDEWLIKVGRGEIQIKR